MLALRFDGALPVAALRGALRDLDPGLALDDVRLLADRVRDSYRVQLFEESRFAIHINKSDKWQVTSDEQDFNSSLVTRHCFSVISETKNSGVTICGTKKPAAALKSRMRACRRTFAMWPKFQVTR